MQYEDIHMFDECWQRLYPEMREETTKQRKAKKAMLIAAAEASVKTLSEPCLILLVKGIAAEAADINKYAPICSNNPPLV